jgi:hypothetical protein
MKVRKRPVVVEAEALQFTGDNAAEVQRYLGDTPFKLLDSPHSTDPNVIAAVWDKLHSSWVGVKAGQWIMIGTKGESWPVDDEVFAETYEPVDPE